MYFVIYKKYIYDKKLGQKKVLDVADEGKLRKDILNYGDERTELSTFCLSS